MQQTIKCKEKLLDLSSPKIMGILNLTNDSFYKLSRVEDKSSILSQAEKMLLEGAAILDLGGMSSRPGALPISEAEELDRIVPAVELLAKEFPHAILSIDTYRTAVAKEAIQHGAHMINDISAARFEHDLLTMVAALEVPYILMHMQGEPADMQLAPDYENVLENVFDFFIEKLALIRDLGIKDVILDLGFGFGKTIEHNYQLLANMRLFTNLGLPILAGISRKSMICRPLNVSPSEALNGSTALHVMALEQGAKLLRVHDVKEAHQAIVLWSLYQENKQQTTF